MFQEATSGITLYVVTKTQDINILLLIVCAEQNYLRKANKQIL